MLSFYLFVCFGALILYKTTVLGEAGISYLPSGLAAIKALILAKFIMLGHMIGLGDRRRGRIIYVIAHKASIYLVLLFFLSAVEEAVVGLVHGRPISASLAEFGGTKLPQTLATSLIMLLILIPYLASRELNVVLGKVGFGLSSSKTESPFSRLAGLLPRGGTLRTRETALSDDRFP